jgi:DNA-directed RNA polymerase specialized sigma24 family protein
MSDTSPTDPVAEEFEAQRDRLRAVSFRMLGSNADAQDVVQEAWLRLARQDAMTIHNLAGWLTTVVARISLDVLRSRQPHPQTSHDGLPQLVVLADDGPTPEDEVVLADSVGLALAAAVRGRSVLVNGLPGIVSWRKDGAPLSVMAFTVIGGRIAGIAAVTDPARLALMNLPEPA